MRASLVDTSRWQGSVNVAQIAGAGFVGMAARCTMGWSGKDPLYDETFAQARQVPNFSFGAYHLLWPANKNPAKEAGWFLEQSGAVDFCVLDVELLHGLQLREVQAQARVWLNEVANAKGVRTIVYTGSWFWKAASGMGIEQDFDLWEAEYTVSQPRGGIDRDQQPETEKPNIVGWTEAKLWQWTSGGKPVGVQSQSLDYNVFMGDEDELRDYLNLGPPPLTDKEKLDLLWNAHPELHP